MTARASVEALRRAGPNPPRASCVAGQKNAERPIEGLCVSYRDGDHAVLSLVDLAIVTREGRFRH